MNSILDGTNTIKKVNHLTEKVEEIDYIKRKLRQLEHTVTVTQENCLCSGASSKAKDTVDQGRGLNDDNGVSIKHVEQKLLHVARRVKAHSTEISYVKNLALSQNAELAKQVEQNGNIQLKVEKIESEMKDIRSKLISQDKLIDHFSEKHGRLAAALRRIAGGDEQRTTGSGVAKQPSIGERRLATLMQEVRQLKQQVGVCQNDLDRIGMILKERSGRVGEERTMHYDKNSNGRLNMSSVRQQLSEMELDIKQLSTTSRNNKHQVGSLLAETATIKGAAVKTRRAMEKLRRRVDRLQKEVSHLLSGESLQPSVL